MTIVYHKSELRFLIIQTLQKFGIIIWNKFLSSWARKHLILYSNWTQKAVYSLSPNEGIIISNSNINNNTSIAPISLKIPAQRDSKQNL